MNTTYFEDTLSHSTCFVKYNIFCLSQCFQIVGTLDQNALIAGSTDSCEET